MNRIKNMFEQAGAFLVDLMKLDQPGKGKLELQQDITSLAAGNKSAVRNYYVKKVAAFLAVLLAGCLLSLICVINNVVNDDQMTLQTLDRPGYGEGDRKESLTVQVEKEEEKQQFEITVQERKYTDQEKQQLLDHALHELETIILGSNDSLDEVRQDLFFPPSMENNAVKLSWLTIPYGVIDEDGSLKAPDNDDGTLVEIRATLTCDGQEAAYTTFANVFPPVLSEEEQLYQAIRREVEIADYENSYEEQLILPETVDGRPLTWMKPEETYLPAIAALTLILAVCLYFEMDSQVHKKAEERKNQLLLDYPDLMWKMNMLLGAGLSIKGTFARIAEEYQKEKSKASGKAARKKENIRYVYEEVACTCYEMNSGISEAQAYERFGRRCQLPEYIRLGSVLSQNLKKGAKGLTNLLETEAEASLNDRKNHARKIGEQAGTKLLMPMVMMLGIVLVILMVPAFLSF